MNNPAEFRLDDYMAESLCEAMKDKLAQKRREGRRGWNRHDEVSNDNLAFMLVDHLRKGDPVDIANFAGMLYYRDGGGDALRKVAGMTLSIADPGGTCWGINFIEWFARLRCLAQAHGFPLSPDQESWREMYQAELTPGDALSEEIRAAADG